MGLDLTIYKENKKGKRREIDYFSSDGWIIVRYFEGQLNKPLYDSEISVSLEQIRDLIKRCANVLIAYYNRTFEEPNVWIEAVKDNLHEPPEDEYTTGVFIDEVSRIYDSLWKIQEELYDNESIILNISY